MLIAGLLALALAIPAAPTARVNDYAGLLTSAERARLEAQLAEREQATGAQMVIAIFKSLEGESLEDYSIRLAQQWRIGQKSLDNGVILLVFVQDRKMRMEVGYGLEPAIPDAVAGRIIRDTMGPRFREQRYAQGLEEAVQAVFARVDTRAPSPGPEQRARPSRFTPSFSVLFVIAVILFFVVKEMAAPRRRASRNAYTAGRRGWYAPAVMFPWFGSGRSGGGGWGGGGGGFSGGGGSFGGGGASGSW